MRSPMTPALSWTQFLNEETSIALKKLWFSYPVYVVRSVNMDDAVLGPALAGLRTILAA
jgi:hypothetical protein